jgi:MFS family permease
MVAWGILYYAFTVFVGPMQAETGWSRPFLNAGLSLGLLVWGACALPVGAWIQRRGGRQLMAFCSGLGGAALVLMGAFPHPVAYFAAWLLIGAAMAGMLYDAAFAIVTVAFGEHYRRGITLITLVGGLASTVFIPIAQFAIDHLGWREALMALGFGQLLLGVPLHYFGIPKFDIPPNRKSGEPDVSVKQRLGQWWTGLRRDIADPRFLGLMLWFTAHAAAFTGLIFQLVPTLQTLGVDNTAMLTAIAIIGPMQVLGRLALAARGGRFSTLRVGQWAMTGLVVALLILALMPAQMGWLALFAAIYGASNGVMTILRGTAIAELFGRERYAELNGALSAPAVLAKAGAPLALAGLWSVLGEPRVVFGAVLVMVLIGFAGLLVARKSQVAQWCGRLEIRTAPSLL